MERMTKKEIRLEVENALKEYDCFHIYNFKILFIDNKPDVEFQKYSVILLGNNKCIYEIWKDNFDNSIQIGLLTRTINNPHDIIKGGIWDE